MEEDGSFKRGRAGRKPEKWEEQAGVEGEGTVGKSEWLRWHLPWLPGIRRLAGFWQPEKSGFARRLNALTGPHLGLSPLRWGTPPLIS